MATFYTDFSTLGTGMNPGTSADPWGYPRWLTFIENGGDAAGSIFRMNGTYDYLDVDVFMGNPNQTLDGWNRSEGGFDAWIITDEFDYYGSDKNADGLTTARGVLGNLTLTMRVISDSNEYAWKSCYMRHATSLQVDVDHSSCVFRFEGCTIHSPLFAVGYNGQIGNVYRFTDCLFLDCEFDVASNYTVICTNCTFVGKTQSQVGNGTNITYIGCTFSVTLSRDIPSDITTFTTQNMRYSLFGLPEQDNAFTGYDHGYADEDRQGVGAFYFGIPAASASVDSETGAAPDNKQFTGTEDAAVTGHFWDFGDGTTSDEKDPAHTYESPGEYEVTYVITDALGNTSTTTLTIYIHNWDYGSGYVVSKTDFCARHAIPQQPSQGVGWSFYNGEAFPYPIGKTGTIELQSPVDESVPLVMDATTFKIHEMGRDDQWKDGEDEYAGSEIESEVIYPELYAKLGSDIYRHSETHINVKPWYKNVRSVGEFDADGYRPGMSMDAALRQDSLPTDFVVTREVPIDGQIVADRHFESKFIQLVTRVVVAPWRLVMTQMWAKLFSKGSAPPKKLMSEMSWALAWSTPLLWIGRDQLSPTMDRATGVAAGGSFSNTTIGPDGKSGSAVVMGITDSLTATMAATGSGDFAVGVWLRSLSDEVVIFDDGELRLRVRFQDEGYALRFEDDNNDIRVYLNETYAAWTHLVVVRDGSSLIVYENGALTNTANLPDSTESYGGAVTLLSGGCQFSDLRIVSNAPDLESVLYMHRDMTEHQGDTTCPIW